MTSDAEVEVFDTTKYLLERYGCRMTKREVGFEARKSRATLDNMRHRGHPSYCEALARAEIGRGERAVNGVAVLFRTSAIGEWLDSVAKSGGGSAATKLSLFRTIPG